MVGRRRHGVDAVKGAAARTAETKPSYENHAADENGYGEPRKNGQERR